MVRTLCVDKLIVGLNSRADDDLIPCGEGADKDVQSHCLTPGKVTPLKIGTIYIAAYRTIRRSLGISIWE